MKIASILLLVVSTLFLQLPCARGASDAPPRANWLPFSSKNSKAAKTTKVSSSSMLKTPQVVTKMSDGTKRIVSNTKNVLTPKKSTSKNKNGTMPGYSVKAKQPEPGFFQKLMHPEPPPPPATIKEWMSLKQIHP